jgi:hypothetical protein
MANEDLITLCTVQTSTEAELIRNALKSVGIACEIGGESQGGFAGVLQIDVLIHESDADEARKYLRKLRREKIARKKKRLEAKKAKEAGASSEAIQELPPRKKPPKK